MARARKSGCAIVSAMPASSTLSSGNWARSRPVSVPATRRASTQYVDNIRELERRIKIAMSNAVKEPESDIPFGLPQNRHEHFRLMYDPMALASRRHHRARSPSCSVAI